MTATAAPKKAEIKADAEAINTACQADAQAANCKDEKVGGGLLKCMWVYKKANPKFQFSAECKEAMSHMKKDRKEMKEARAADKKEDKKEDEKSKK